MNLRKSSAALVMCAAVIGATFSTQSMAGASSHKKPQTLQAVVSGIKHGGLGVCKTTDNGQEQNWTAYFTLALQNCGKFSPFIQVFAFSNSDAAYSELVQGGAGKGVSDWLVGKLAVEGLGLTQAENATFNHLMKSFRGKKYSG